MPWQEHTTPAGASSSGRERVTQFGRDCSRDTGSSGAVVRIPVGAMRSVCILALCVAVMMCWLTGAHIGAMPSLDSCAEGLIRAGDCRVR